MNARIYLIIESLFQS